MERNTKHRILGVFVIVGLTIILLPFFQGGSKMPPAETILSKAPPFPGQVTQLSEAEPQTDNAATSGPLAMPVAAAPTAAVPTMATNPVTPAAAPVNTAPVTEVVPNNQLSSNAATTPELSPNGQAEALETSALTVPKVTPKKTFKVKQAAIHAKTKVKPKTITAQAPLNDNGLFNLKSAVWVIQIGSFKNKAQALRIVNQLRKNDYRAFIQHMPGGVTQVFVGPESRRVAANQLAGQLEIRMHMRGIVISYQPLTL
jgi:DedD protein